MSLLSRLEARSVENPLRPLTDKSLIDVLGGMPTRSGISVHEESAIGKFIAIYRAVALVSGAIASLELRAFREGAQRERFRSPLVDNPHPDMTRMEFWETKLAHQLLWGNTYSMKVRDGAGVVTELWPLSPRRFSVRRIEPTRANPWGKEFDLRHDDGTVETLTPREILHIPGPGYNGLTGLSPIGVARQAVGMGLAAEEYGARLFGSGMLAGGILETEQKLDQPTADALKKRIMEKLSGIGKAHEVAVLDAGAKFHQLTIPPEDAQFIESRKFQVTEIARLYGIPPHLLGDVEKSTSWGTGIEQQSIGFVVYTLRPWLTRAEQRFSRECLPAGVRAEFNTDGLLRGDAKARADAAKTWLGFGVKKRSEVRIEEGLPPDEETDNYMTPLNYVLSDADEVSEDELPDNVIALSAARALTAWLERQERRPVESSTNGREPIVSREEVLAKRAELESAGKPAGVRSVAKALNVSATTVFRRLNETPEQFPDTLARA